MTTDLLQLSIDSDKLRTETFILQRQIVPISLSLSRDIYLVGKSSIIGGLVYNTIEYILLPSPGIELTAYIFKFANHRFNPLGHFSCGNEKKNYPVL